jgi:hypothetical protein
MKLFTMGEIEGFDYGRNSLCKYGIDKNLACCFFDIIHSLLKELYK